jgi:hypothetical protein
MHRTDPIYAAGTILLALLLASSFLGVAADQRSEIRRPLKP